MKCPKCGSDVRMQVSVFIDAPANLQHNLPKKSLQRSDVKVLGVAWDRMSWYCPKGDWADHTLARPPEAKG